MLVCKFKSLKWQEKIFILSSIALILFGAMSYFLGELCSGSPDEWQLRPIDSVISSLFIDKYLLWLALSIVIGMLFCRGMNSLRKLNSRRRWIRITLAVILVIWNILMIILCVVTCADSEDLTLLSNGTQYVSRSEEIQRIQSKSVWFGRGDHYYTYPDHENLLREHHEDAELIWEVTDVEQTRAYFGFGRWRSETLLPILTYCFGKWIGVLYFVIVLFWLVGSSVGFVAVKGKCRRVLYGTCMSLVGIQLVLTLLDYYGIATWSMPVVFSTADWTAMIPIATIQLTVMWFLIRADQKVFTDSQCGRSIDDNSMNPEVVTK